MVEPFDGKGRWCGERHQRGSGTALARGIRTCLARCGAFASLPEHVIQLRILWSVVRCTPYVHPHLCGVPHWRSRSTWRSAVLCSPAAIAEAGKVLL